MLHELLWAVVALALLGVLLLLGLAKSPYDFRPSGLRGLEDIFEAGLFGAGFIVVCLILAVPLYPFYLLGMVVWRRFHPPLPVEGDDPLWGRNVNRKVVEAAFLAVQHAWMKRSPDAARQLVSSDLYTALARECERLTAQHDVNMRQDIHVQDISLSDERIDKTTVAGKDNFAYSFKATIRGTMTNFITNTSTDEIKAGSSTPQAFEEKLEFSRRPNDGDRWQMTSVTGWPYEMYNQARTSRRKRKRRAAEAAASAF